MLIYSNYVNTWYIISCTDCVLIVHVIKCNVKFLEVHSIVLIYIYIYCNFIFVAILMYACVYSFLSFFLSFFSMSSEYYFSDENLQKDFFLRGQVSRLSHINCQLTKQWKFLSIEFVLLNVNCWH